MSAPRAVHQFVPVLHVGDAVGRHIVGLRDVLRKRGIASEIYVESEDVSTSKSTRPETAYSNEARAGDVLVYQLATASGLADFLEMRPETLIVNYHNITPPELIAPWNDFMARSHVRAHEQLRRLAGRAFMAVTVSEFNRRELVVAGYEQTQVVPPVVFAADRELPAREVPEPPYGSSGESSGGSSGESGGSTRLLAVGRLAPNKAVEDALIALLIYRQRYDPAATLTVVGRPAVRSYAIALREFVARLGLRDAVTFAGHVSEEDLAEAYRRSDALLVTSVHEGFCIPLVEAMHHGVPVVASAAGAIPEVLGDSGVLLDSADPTKMAEAVWHLRSEPSVREKVLSAQTRRLGELELDRAADRFADLVTSG